MNAKRGNMAALVTTLLLATLALSSMASPQRLLSGAPLTVGTSTNAALSLGDCSTVSVEIDASNNTDSTDQTIVNVNGSNDGVDWNPLATITLVNAGTLTASVQTNLTAGAIDQLQVTISNTTVTANLTNFVTVTTNGKRKL